jgi:predicted transcriptional regulator
MSLSDSGDGGGRGDGGGGAAAESLVEISDVRALTALAHPVRLSLLQHLMAVGPRTASQCAAVVGASPSNCSYHLRLLARFGMVEPVEADDGRERPWRAAATGFRFGGPEGDPATRAAAQALTMAQLEESARLARDFLRRIDAEGEDWQQAVAFGTYALALTSAELTELVTALDRLIRPYIALTRQGTPPDARPVHLNLEAFPLAEQP